MPYAPAFPHDPIEAIAEDVFLVRGSLRLNPLLRISRNMTVVRHHGELSLINPVRLDEGGLAELERLGKVRRIMRLGSLHGLDDAWYAHRYRAEFWCGPGGRRYPEPAIDIALSEDRPLPFPDSTLFAFSAVEPEFAILLARGNGLLLTCDAVQHYGDYRYMSPTAKMILPFIGFPKTTLIGPIWLRAMTPKGGSLSTDFDRLLSLDFDSLVSAHGSFLPSGAKRAVREAVRRTFAA